MTPYLGATVAKKSTDVSVKIDPELYRLIKTLAGWRGDGVTDCLNQLVEPPLRKEIAKMRREMGQDEKE